MDLRESTPVDDLIEMLSRPKEFLISLRENAHIDFWVLIKSLGGALIASALISWSSLPASMVTAVDFLQSSMSHVLMSLPPKYSWLASGSNEMTSGMASGVDFIVGMSLFKALIGPVLHLFSIFIISFGIMMMLPFLGVHHSRASYFQVLAVLGYCQWAAVLYLLPGVGGILGFLMSLLIPILAIKSVFQISFMRAYAAFFFFPLAIFLSGVLGMFFFLGLGLKA